MMQASYKILVVDDEPDLERLVLQRMRREIRSGRFSFVFAHNGVEALELLNEDRSIDMVLSDINMPQMDGLTLLEQIPSVDPNVPLRDHFSLWGYAKYPHSDEPGCLRLHHQTYRLPGSAGHHRPDPGSPRHVARGPRIPGQAGRVAKRTRLGQQDAAVDLADRGSRRAPTTRYSHIWNLPGTWAATSSTLCHLPKVESA